MDFESRLEQLPEALRPALRQHCEVLKSRLTGTTGDHDDLMCLLISAKVLDDEHDYDCIEWGFTFDMEVEFLERLKWCACVLGSLSTCLSCARASEGPPEGPAPDMMDVG